MRRSQGRVDGLKSLVASVREHQNVWDVRNGLGQRMTSASPMQTGTLQERVDFVRRCDEPDVYEAIASLVDENGCISGTIPDLRKRIYELLKRLRPEAAKHEWLAWTGFTRLSRAADRAIAEMFTSMSPRNKPYLAHG